MCGILGIVGKNPVNQLLYDGLLVLQHRGQDAAGIVTCDGNTFFMHKNNGASSHKLLCSSHALPYGVLLKHYYAVLIHDGVFLILIVLMSWLG